MHNYSLNRKKEQQQPMIPVCCICNKQRTSVDTWEQVDISQYSEETITHGFCPDCIREHYPKISEKIDEVPS